MKKLGLLFLLSSLLMYGESLIIDIRQFTNRSRAVATLFKTDAVRGVVTIRSEEELKKIFRKAEAAYSSNYTGRITFEDVEPGNYHLDVNVGGEDLCGYLETFLYTDNIIISPGESKSLELITTNLKKGIFAPTLRYNAILDKLQEKKSILQQTVELDAGESYIKNLSVEGKNIRIQINAQHYSRNESASITRGDRLGSNGFYLVRNDPSLEIRLDVDSKTVSNSPCYFDEYWEIKNWKHLYSDIFTYSGGRIDLAIDPFILEFYPSLNVRTGMGEKGPLKNHFYFEGIFTTGPLYLYQIEGKGVQIKKGASGRLEIIE